MSSRLLGSTGDALTSALPELLAVAPTSVAVLFSLLAISSALKQRVAGSAASR